MARLAARAAFSRRGKPTVITVPGPSRASSTVCCPHTVITGPQHAADQDWGRWPGLGCRPALGLLAGIWVADRLWGCWRTGLPTGSGAAGQDLGRRPVPGAAGQDLGRRPVPGAAGQDLGRRPVPGAAGQDLGRRPALGLLARIWVADRLWGCWPGLGCRPALGLLARIGVAGQDWAADQLWGC